MSEFRFKCPYCGEILDCPENFNGVETECPICNKQIIPVCENKNETTSNITPNTYKVKTNNNVIVYFLLIINIIAICLIIISLEFGLFPKSCTKNEPQIYIEAQRDMVRLLELIKQTFIKDRIIWEDSNIEKMFNKQKNLDYTAQIVIKYAKQYLICQGKCPNHMLKYNTIAAAFFALDDLETKYDHYSLLIQDKEILTKKYHTVIQNANHELYNAERAAKAHQQELKENTENLYAANETHKKLQAHKQEMEKDLRLRHAGPFEIARKQKGIITKIAIAKREINTIQKKLDTAKQTTMQINEKLQQARQNLDIAKRKVLEYKKEIEKKEIDAKILSKEITAKIGQTKEALNKAISIINNIYP